MRYDKHAIEYSQHFLRRGYPLKFIEEAVISARHTERETLLTTETKEQDTTPPTVLVTTYHPHNDDLREIVSQHWDMLGRNNTTMNLYNDGYLVGYRRPRNLRDILVQARVKKPEMHRHKPATWTSP